LASDSTSPDDLVFALLVVSSSVGDGGPNLMLGRQFRDVDHFGAAMISSSTPALDELWRSLAA